MDKKSKIFLWVFALLIIGTIGMTFWKIIIKKDYIIEAQADCDPTLEKCFVYECDSEAEECTGNPDEDISYYKLITRNASNIPLCDPLNEFCQALVCPEGEAECEIFLCNEETKSPEDICNDPEQYNLDNLVPEELFKEVDLCDPQQDIPCDVNQEGILSEDLIDDTGTNTD